MKRNLTYGNKLINRWITPGYLTLTFLSKEVVHIGKAEPYSVPLCSANGTTYQRTLDDRYSSKLCSTCLDRLRSARKPEQEEQPPAPEPPKPKPQLQRLISHQPPRKKKVQEYFGKNDVPCFSEFHLNGLGANVLFQCERKQGHDGDHSYELVDLKGKIGRLRWS